MQRLVESAFSVVMPFNELDRSSHSDAPILLITTSQHPSPSPKGAEMLTKATAKAYEGKASRVLFDARESESPHELDSQLHFLGTFVANHAKRNAKVLVVTDNNDILTSSVCEGFVRSLSKEIGGKGITINLLEIDSGDDSDDSDDSALVNDEAVQYFLSGDSCFVTGQRLVIDGSTTSSAVSQNENVVLTGAARGIGLETAKAIAGLNGTKNLLLVDHPAMSDHLERSVEEVKKIVGNKTLLVSGLSVDVCDDDAGELIGKEIGAGIDSMIHAAGVTRDKTMKRMDRERFMECMEINLHAVKRIDDTLFGNKLYNENCRITLLSSTSGVAGNFGQTNYASSKSGLIGYAQWRTEQERGRSDAGVNCVAPGFISTPMTDNLPIFNRVIVPRFMTNLGCMGQPKDVANTIKFLSSKRSGAKGTFLRCCGGLLLGR